MIVASLIKAFVFTAAIEILRSSKVSMGGGSSSRRLAGLFCRLSFARKAPQQPVSSQV